MNDFVGEARNALRETKADAELGLYVVPDVNRLTESLTGQRISDLARLVDWVAPMLYHNILLQPPTWIASAVSSVVKVAGKKTLPVLQADFLDPRPPRSLATGDGRCRTPDWSETLCKPRRPEIDGLIVFPLQSTSRSATDATRSSSSPATMTRTSCRRRPDQEACPAAGRTRRRPPGQLPHIAGSYCGFLAR